MILFLRQFQKFGIVGILNTAIDFLVLNLLTFVTNTYQGNLLIILNLTAFFTATVNSYYWNRWFVFKDTEKQKRRFHSFLAISMAGALLNTTVLFCLVDQSLNCILTQAQSLNAAKLAATAVSMIWNFLGYKMYVFRTN